MTKLISTLYLITLFIQSIKAQSDPAVATVHYTFIHIMDTTQRETPFKEEMVLYIGKSSTCYLSYDALMRRATFKPLNNTSTAGKSPESNNKPVPNSGRNIDVVSETPLGSFYQIFLSNSYYLYPKKKKMFHLNYAGGTLFAIDELYPSIIGISYQI